MSVTGAGQGGVPAGASVGGSAGAGAGGGQGADPSGRGGARVLLTNDDGIHAPGIVALHDALHAPGSMPDGGPIARSMLVVAPLTVQSATGHGVTFRQPLITRDVQASATMHGVAVDGRPADCVKLALSELWGGRMGDARPGLVVSGMNMGANVGINVLYSGTVAAALEAAFLGVPAIAVSLHHGAGTPRYDVAARHACAVIARLLGRGPLRPHQCVSINIPVTEHDGPVPPVSVCPVNTHGVVDRFTRNVNPLGETYYWSAGTPLEFHATETGSDVQELFARRVTVTPLQYDLTDHGGMGALRGLLQ